MLAQLAEVWSTIDLCLIVEENHDKDGRKEMRGINQIFDLADNVLDALEGKPVGSTAAQRSPAPSVNSTTRSGSGKPEPRVAAPSRALSRANAGHGAYRIVESHDGGTGEVRYVVTNGRDRAECNSATFAQKVKDCLG
jgi:cyanophycinase-like exopeptidase